MLYQQHEDGRAEAWPSAILFDLDGTLIDSVPDLASSVNVVLAEEGLAPFTPAEVRLMVGGGVKLLVQRAFAARGVELAGAPLEARTGRMMAVYAERLTDETTLLPGVREIVAHYVGCGTRLGVVTNKPEAAVHAILRHFGIDDAFAVVVGDRVLPRKPAPDMLLHALQVVGRPAARAVMVGDSVTDVEAARAAGLPAIVVRGGYTSVPVEALEADAIAEDLFDLPRALGEFRTLAAP